MHQPRFTAPIFTSMKAKAKQPTEADKAVYRMKLNIRKLNARAWAMASIDQEMSRLYERERADICR